MNWEPGRSEPRRAQASIQGACASDRGLDGTEVGRSDPGHAAGGAHAIATVNSPLAVRRQHTIVGEQHQLSGPDGGDGGQALTLVRDEEFYIDSADCVIRVEGTLFRVRVVLFRSKPSFSPTPHFSSFGCRTNGMTAPQPNTLR